MKKEEIEWCCRMFSMLRLGASWGIPRSGLIFEKINTKTVALVDAMPFSTISTLRDERGGEFESIKSEFPRTEEELIAYQRSDYQAVKLRFEVAGIAVENRVNPLFDINNN